MTDQEVLRMNIIGGLTAYIRDHPSNELAFESLLDLAITEEDLEIIAKDETKFLDYIQSFLWAFR